jgi:hypothetical protein
MGQALKTILNSHVASINIMIVLTPDRQQIGRCMQIYKMKVVTYNVNYLPLSLVC